MSTVRPNPGKWQVKRPLVLLIDPDRRVLVPALRLIEKNLGYGAIAAEDGVEGERLARQYHPDLIITETLMPKGDGRELCLHLKQNRETADIKVVVATSLYAQEKNRAEAFRRFQVDEYLFKPVSYDELRSLFQRYLH